MSSRPIPALQAHSLTKCYGRQVAVDRVSFQAAAGVVTGFVGPNGAGKSTTLRMILGLDRPTSGTATILGHRMPELPSPVRTVGALLDARGVHPKRSAENHLAAIARAGHLPHARVAETLERVGLADVANRPAGDYSLGMQQRLGIAAALLGDPKVVILDEPLNGLDPEGIRWARSLMRDLAAEGRTVLFSSHLMGEMELTADHLIVIHRGRVLADQSLSSFLASHATQRVRVRTGRPTSQPGQLDRLSTTLGRAGLNVRPAGDDGIFIADATTDQIGRIATAQRVDIAELSSTRDSLEDAFLNLTRHHLADHADHQGGS